MKNILVLVSLISAALNANAETDTREFYDGKVIVEYSVFNEGEKAESEIKYLVECGDCIGIDGYLPETVLNKISIVNQKGIFVLPRVLISKVYNPHVGKEHIKDTFSVKGAAGGVEIKFSGGDGSGSYDVVFDLDLIDLKAMRKVFQFPDMENPTLLEAKIEHVSKNP